MADWYPKQNIYFQFTKQLEMGKLLLYTLCSNDFRYWKLFNVYFNHLQHIHFPFSFFPLFFIAPSILMSVFLKSVFHLSVTSYQRERFVRLLDGARLKASAMEN